MTDDSPDDSGSLARDIPTGHPRHDSVGGPGDPGVKERSLVEVARDYWKERALQAEADARIKAENAWLDVADDVSGVPDPDLTRWHAGG